MQRPVLAGFVHPETIASRPILETILALAEWAGIVRWQKNEFREIPVEEL
jgi:hypothetical protein